MVVPGKQQRLENDCKDGNERGEPARSVPARRKEAEVRFEVHAPSQPMSDLGGTPTFMIYYNTRYAGRTTFATSPLALSCR